MSKIIVSGTCPLTASALYVREIKPGLITRGAVGDWGYTNEVNKAASLSVYHADRAWCDMSAAGLKPQILSA